MNTFRTITHAAVLACLACAAGAASAAAPDSFPNKPVRLLVGFAPGGPADIAARVIAEGLQQKLKQPFVVENRSGAGGNIAAQAVAKSPADGYMLLVATASLTVNPIVTTTAGYDAVKDFTPINIIATQPNAIAVSSTLGVNSVAELQKLAQSKPLTFATSGLGTSSDLTAKYIFNLKWGSQLLAVPYRGAGPAGIAVAGGDPPVGFTTITGVLPLHQEGRVKILAIVDDKRLSALPDVPTLSELGYTGISSSWTALFAPAGTPDAIVQKLNKAIAELTASPVYKEKFNSQLMVAADGKSVAELRKMIQDEVVNWGNVVKATGLQKE